MLLDEQPEVPYIALNVLVAEINYGGRVTDDKDVRLIKALLLKYFTHKVFDEEYTFSYSGTYRPPLVNSLELEKIVD